MSDWAYVAIAYTVIWGALAFYALVLARRVSQAAEVSRRLRQAPKADLESDTRRAADETGEGDTVVCDAPPAP